MDFRVVVIGGVIGCFLVSSIADGLVAKGAAMLSPEVRERIYQRTVKWDMLLRMVDGLGIVFILIGVLGLLGILKEGPQFAWKTGSVGVGFAVLCLERVLGAWITHFAYAKEAGDQPVRGQALSAALLVSVVEIGLAVAVCWWIFTHITYTGPKGSSGSNASSQNTGGSSGGGSDSTFERTYVNEKGALELIGKDKAYFELLVKFLHIRSKENAGIIFYRKDDLTTAMDSGLPTLEEMQEALKRKPLTTNQVIEAVQPFLEKGQLEEALQKVMDLTGWDQPEAEKFLQTLPNGKPAPAPSKTGKTPEGEALQE